MHTISKGRMEPLASEYAHNNGCIHSLDWTGLLDWTAGFKLFFVFLHFIARVDNRFILKSHHLPQDS